MTAVIYIALYAGVATFIAGCLWRAWRYSRTPLHLRWELYPVPHEDPYRATYGGSYFETQEWWRKRQPHGRLAEWRVMAEEILLLKSLREFNRKLWGPSFLFHGGLYLAIGAAGFAILVTLVSVLGIGDPSVAMLYEIAEGIGLAGAVLTILGACLLLFRRATDRALVNATHAADVFNLLLFVATFVLLICGYLLRPAGTASLGEVVRGIFCFDRGVQIGAGFGAGLILASALAAYIPFTHMSHFVAKYFTWHAVRWDDRRMEPGSAIEKQAAVSLGYRPTWAAHHMGADGQHTWAEVAAKNPTAEERK